MLTKNPTLRFEKSLWKAGYLCIAGIDEAGRGAWAGPVCAAAVILPPDSSLVRSLKGVRDSKLMTPGERETWPPRIRAAALAWGVGFASSQEIDSLGILPATRLAATRALLALEDNRPSTTNHWTTDHGSWTMDNSTFDPLSPPPLSPSPISPDPLSPSPLIPDYLSPNYLLPDYLLPDYLIPDYLVPDYLITDYLLFPSLGLPQTALVKGDRLSLSVAAASVLAKTSRDARMRELDDQYPGYGFARHKGYGTRIHQAAIHSLGLCEIHRFSFSISS